jgi:hypothetical protein
VQAITPLRSLPRIDDHTITVAASPRRTWDAVVAGAPRERRLQSLGLALLGCRERRTSGPRGAAGSTVPGFRVARADAPREWRLEGRHRFSDYALTFELEPDGQGGTLLRAITDAAFPGPHGRAYRALVIGSRVHVLAVRRLLADAKRRAERAA